MKPTVFISSSAESRLLVANLKNDLSDDATVITWADEPFSVGRPLLSQFSKSLADADFVVVFLDFPSAVRTRGTVQARPRENIIFELGMFIGRLGPDRVLVVDMTADTRSSGLPSSLRGLTILRAQELSSSSTGGWSQLIANEVRRRIRNIEPRPANEKPAYSCFISYCHQDKDFASKLFDDLSAIGARCWLDVHELRAGDSILDRVTAALIATDRFLPIFSKNSIQSTWFQEELHRALDIEAQRSTTVLIPIRIDDFVFSVDATPWAALRERFIADFRDWRSDRAYNRAFRQFALDLAASVSQDRAQGEH